MNTNRMGRNVLTSLLLQAVSVVCAFILPRLILSAYGSAYNGIVSSVTQFLSCVTLLRAGIGGVTRAALYKSLAENDTKKTSGIVKATEQFMRKIALIFCVALVLFAAVYPLLVQEEFDWFFSFSLVLILGISTAVQYYFGIANQFLLHADQRLYVYNIWQIAATVVNTLFSVLLIYLGLDIRVVKLVSAVAFSITPVMMYCYVRKTYALPKNVAPDNGAIKQRWDAFAHQLAAFVHSNTDVVILTVFTNLRQVSVYTVYNTVVYGINTLIATAANAVEARLGSVLAKQDESQLQKDFTTYELVMHIISTVLFSCTAILLVPFVMLYTKGVEDVSYNQPLLGYLMCLAYWISAIRLPHQNIIEAAGQFKQTKGYAIIEAVLNICLSCLLVAGFGTVGVVMGTVAAMGYRTVCYAFYAQKNILKQSFACFVKRLAVSLAAICAWGVPYFCLGVNDWMVAHISNYGQWVLAAIAVFVITTAVILGMNCLCYPRWIVKIIRKTLKK